ncbi:MAG: ABC transporter permease [Planctomycetota bacterium]|jgi:ABC-type transport system involved in multi-copper enzyme maturation permease subunit
MLQTERAVAECVFKRIGGKWFYGLLGATCLILYGVATMGGPDPLQALKDNRDQAFTLISLVSSILIIVLTATELPRDISGRIIMVLLSRPIARYQIILGKWVGCLLIGGFFVVATSAFTLGVLYHDGLEVDPNSIHLATITLLRCLIIGTAGILFSTGLSEVPTMAFTVAYSAYAFFIPMISGLLAKSELPGAGKYAVSLVTYLAPNMGGNFRPPTTPLSRYLAGTEAQINTVDISDTLMALSGSQGANWSAVGFSSIYALSYTFGLLGLAVLLFRRRILA